MLRAHLGKLLVEERSLMIRARQTQRVRRDSLLATSRQQPSWRKVHIARRNMWLTRRGQPQPPFHNTGSIATSLRFRISKWFDRPEIHTDRAVRAAMVQDDGSNTARARSVTNSERLINSLRRHSAYRASGESQTNVSEQKVSQARFGKRRTSGSRSEVPITAAILLRR